jgi:predicted ribosome quality control (RQC) complex YloA/Tae2 family protein
VSFDALTLAAVRDELEPLLSGARIQKLVFGDELTLAIETFLPERGRANVLLSADSNHSRVQRTASLPARGVETDTPFSLVARKHLRNARIHSVRQPRLERVLELDCEQRDGSGQHYRLTLIVEAMGRRSNLVLVDADGAIIDAARRTPPSRNPRRPVLPHLPYVAPPPQDRLMPEQLDTLPPPGDVALAKYLSDHVAGLSPVAGREIAHRAAGLDWSRVVGLARAFVTSREWHPSVAFVGNQPIEYAPFELTHLGDFRSFDSISAAMDVYYARPVRKGDPLAAERKNLIGPIDKALASAERRVAALEHQLANADELREPLRRAGELILTHQASIAPGAAELSVDRETIALDTTLTPSENAQAYFARYRKTREAEARVPQLLEEARNKVSHLRDLKALVQVADSMDAIRALRREVAAKPGPAGNGPYRRVQLGDGWEALVGTSATGNSAVTFDVASGNDLWLHARNLAGAHVIVPTRGREVPDNVLERAAAVAAWHSSAREAGQVEVDVTLRRYVKKIPEAPPGLVRYSNERTVRVTPQP